MNLSDNVDPYPEPGARVFVWGTWVSLLLFALGFVATYGATVPFWDDYTLVPVLTGDEPLTLSWLWSQHFEHRLFLPRLILVPLNRLSGDYRAGMVVNTLALGTVAAVLMNTARRLRGRSSYSDAFLPLVLLNVGHHANLIRNWQLQFIL